MANIQSSNITQNSFLVRWNFNIPNIENQLIIISGGTIENRMPIIEENIQPSGSKTVSNLVPNGEYTIEIYTNTKDSNGFVIASKDSLVVNTLAESSETSKITAKQDIPTPNNTYKKVVLWFAGLSFFAIVVKIVKNRLKR